MQNTLKRTVWCMEEMILASASPRRKELLSSMKIAVLPGISGKVREVLMKLPPSRKKLKRFQGKKHKPSIWKTFL